MDWREVLYLSLCDTSALVVTYFLMFSLYFCSVYGWFVCMFYDFLKRLQDPQWQ